MIREDSSEILRSFRMDQNLNSIKEEITDINAPTIRRNRLSITEQNGRRRKMSVPVLPYSQRLSASGPPGSLGPRVRKHSTNIDPTDRLGLQQPQQKLRRFSHVAQVGGAVSRKISTLGWGTINVQDIIAQTKSLCCQYIRARLKRNGIRQRKLGLQRMQSLANLPCGVMICEIFSQLHVIGCELERMNPKLYVDVSKQVAVTITNETSVRKILSSIAQDLLKSDITWSKIISLYCVAGGLAVDCVQSGHPEYLFGLVEAMGLVVERDAATWIASQGGWTGLLSHHRPPDDEAGYFQMIALSVLSLIVILAGLVFLLRTIGNMALG